ncbi:MAG: transposase [Alphaproteobacteria bacterium BRH_c36]|nr:MAG: transposase [Alphaproteobacteria bacterium BRH_c36]
MGRFIEGGERDQLLLLPASLEDYVEQDNPVRVVDAFIDELDLGAIGFSGVTPAATGRPSYHPSTMLKLYLYGYLNRVQSSRRLEREARRNVEVMWLTGRLAPDFKTIADFRKNNSAAIQSVCAKFVELCVDIGMFKNAVTAIDGAKFKAVNSRDRNFTRDKLKRRMEQITESIGRYLEALDVADLQEGPGAEEKISRLRDKIAAMRARLAELKEIEQQVHEAPDQQISLTDPDSRAMATNMRGASVVGYNVQAAVDTEHHLIVTHEVTNVVVDRTLLAPMAAKAKDVLRCETLDALADCGYYSGEQLLACEMIGVKPFVPKPRTSNARAAGRFDKEDFDYISEKDAYRCPAGELLPFRMTSMQDNQAFRIYWSSNCADCQLKSHCTPSKERRVRRWEHEHVVDATHARLDAMPEAMTIRRRTVEHPFGTLKSWMGHTHFLTKGLEKVSTEMSLCVLAYNVKRMISMLGVQPLIAAIRT